VLPHLEPGSDEYLNSSGFDIETHFRGLGHEK
jgi:hypothetical protein